MTTASVINECPIPHVELSYSMVKVKVQLTAVKYSLYNCSFKFEPFKVI